MVDGRRSRSAERYRLQKLAEMPIYCEHGHTLRKGPMGLRICEVCTQVTLKQIREDRRRGIGVLPPTK